MEEDRESIPQLPTDSLRKAPTVDGTHVRLYASQVVARRYEIVERLGRGAIGDVWHAYDLKLRVDVALKAIRRTTPEAVEALRREVRTAREVVSPNVCRIFDLIVEEEQELLSMEYIDGVTLLDFLHKKSPLQLQEALKIGLQFLSGLEAIHEAGLIHRDLKPENIMITRTGRVMVMDFGIAEQAALIDVGISGTPPYMSPEQLGGSIVDVRSDIFAAGAVLAELMSTIHDQESREEVWKSVRGDPQHLPEGPWRAVIARAVAKNPDHRFASARALARALEEATEAVESRKERKPYPGLLPFTQADAEYFFGRELEVETILKQIAQFHLTAIIGPSGAGKTSFLRAGLIPVLPTGWSHALLQPGDSPLLNLAQAVASEFSAEAIRDLVQMQEMDKAFSLLLRWRKNHPEVLLIVDRFEELFTLNDTATQARFAELIERAVLEADVRVLLAMRDDFLIFCNQHSALAPAFSSLIPLLPLTGPALRRALIQPALQCGYRFEDEALVEEILNHVEKERGALPLMAFAAARLWEKRDQQNGLLTRAAYSQIGGVSGALAQHAEATMQRIGVERRGIVREVFRNLVTSQNTRAARDTEEILSIFEDRQSAEEVLRSLIDARLLTSFEAPGHDGEKPKRRLEIIHESLLSAWPRLVRWQTQDADSAQFRDQLRNAAQVWQERGCPTDLLWTGASYKEFEVWREKYAGGLSSIEKVFADTMLQHARKQRRKRMFLLSATFVILLTLLGLISGFWRQAETARQDAVSHSQQAEASKLLALGQKELEQDPTIALAYAIASLEVADTPAARRFAVQALWTGPPAFIMPDMPNRPGVLVFSPSGKWLAVRGPSGLQVLANDGGDPIILEAEEGKSFASYPPRFSTDEKYVVWSSNDDPSVVHVWSMVERKEVRRFKFEGNTMCETWRSQLYLVTQLSGSLKEWERCRFRVWSYDQNEPRVIGDWNIKGLWKWMNPSIDGRWISYVRGRNVYVRPFEDFERTPEQSVGSHDQDALRVVFHPDGNLIASSDSSGEIRMWRRTQGSGIPVHKIPARNPVYRISFSESGRFFGAGYENKDRTLGLWDMNGPVEADALILRRNVSPFFPNLVFDPSNRWAVVPYNDSLAFWRISSRYPYVLHGRGDACAESVHFTPDGKSLVAGFAGAQIRTWDLSNLRTPGRDIWKGQEGFQEIHRIEMDAAGKRLAAGTFADRVHVISIADGKSRHMPASESSCFVNASISPDGRTVAAPPLPGEEIHLWDIETNQVRVLKGASKMNPYFSPDGKLYSGDKQGNLRAWDIKSGTSKIILSGSKTLYYVTFVRNAPHLILGLWSDREEVDLQKASSELKIFDARTGSSRTITTHGNRLTSVAADPGGKVLVTGDLDGIVRVGPITGEEPHLLFGSKSGFAVAVHPDLKWIASSEQEDSVVRLWHMPQGKPLHTLPYKQLLKKLRSLTNVRVVAEETSPTGYRIQFDPFPGWKDAPTW